MKLEVKIISLKKTIVIILLHSLFRLVLRFLE